MLMWRCCNKLQVFDAGVVLCREKCLVLVLQYDLFCASQSLDTSTDCIKDLNVIR